jgi:hypothetical protein
MTSPFPNWGVIVSCQADRSEHGWSTIAGASVVAPIITKIRNLLRSGGTKTLIHVAACHAEDRRRENWSSVRGLINSLCARLLEQLSSYITLGFVEKKILERISQET